MTGLIDQILDHTADMLASSALPYPTVTKTSGNSTCTVRGYAGYGNSRLLSMSFHTTAATAVGGNVFVGKLPASAWPKISTFGAGYIGSTAVIGTIGATDGTITIRVIGAQLSANVDVYIYFTYFV